MKGQSSLRKQAKFNLRILCGSQRILRSLMPNQHPACVSLKVNSISMVITDECNLVHL